MWLQFLLLILQALSKIKLIFSNRYKSTFNTFHTGIIWNCWNYWRTILYFADRKSDVAWKSVGDSPVSVVIDTMQHVVRALPMKFPQLITYKDFGTSAGNGEDYYRCFTGDNFVYSFYYSELMYKADIRHQMWHPVRWRVAILTKWRF